MSKEFALFVVRRARRLVRCKYYQPDYQSIGGEADFQSWMDEFDGLEKYINDISRDLSVEDKTP